MRRLLIVTLVLSGCGNIPPASSGNTSTTSNGSGSTGTNTGSTGEPASLTGITAAHNSARSNVDPPASKPLPALSWDATLASDAQNWASNCQFAHSHGPYGENIYASYGMAVTGASVVDSWVSEKANYDYANNSCSGVCGHYTQVVWASSIRLGCALQVCSQNSPFGTGGNWDLVVCEYDPPGNDLGQRPY